MARQAEHWTFWAAAHRGVPVCVVWREARVDAGADAEIVGALAGVSGSMVRHWERARHVPRGVQLTRYLAALDTLPELVWVEHPDGPGVSRRAGGRVR